MLTFVVSLLFFDDKYDVYTDTHRIGTSNTKYILTYWEGKKKKQMKGSNGSKGQ